MYNSLIDRVVRHMKEVVMMHPLCGYYRCENAHPASGPTLTDKQIDNILIGPAQRAATPAHGVPVANTFAGNGIGVQSTAKK
jgi:hypothetical protein